MRGGDRRSRLQGAALRAGEDEAERGRAQRLGQRGGLHQTASVQANWRPTHEPRRLVPVGDTVADQQQVEGYGAHSAASYRSESGGIKCDGVALP